MITNFVIDQFKIMKLLLNSLKSGKNNLAKRYENNNNDRKKINIEKTKKY